MSTGARRILTRTCIAVSAVILAALAISPALDRRAPLGGLGIYAAAAVSVVAGLVYLRRPRRPDDDEWDADDCQCQTSRTCYLHAPAVPGEDGAP